MSGPAPPEPSPGPDPAPDAVLASPGARLGGAVVDGAVLQVAGLAMVGVSAATAAALGTIAYLAYSVGMVAARGQTVGKLALGTSVVDGAGGGRPSLWQAATRAVVPLAGVVVDAALGTAAVGAVWVFAVYGSLLFDDRRRGVHDRAAGTVVRTVERSEAHRRLGAVAVAAALVVTVVALAFAADDGTEPPAAAGVGAGRRSPVPGGR